jgi:GT2 family glycosyltransferase
MLINRRGAGLIDSEAIVQNPDSATDLSATQLLTAISEVPVIVLNWNRWEHTFACLHSLKTSADVRTVWLVDNASAEDRSKEAEAILHGLRFVRLDQNYGFAGGMNRALQIAAREGFEFAYLLNNDCTVTPGFLRNAVEAARRSNVAVVGSRIAYADASNSVLFDGEYYAPGQKPIDAPFETHRAQQANGAGMLVRLNALEAVGYFDERFFCYHEEVDLCWRLAGSGFEAVIAAGSLVRHSRAGSDVDGNSAYYRTRNEFLLARHFRGLRKLKRQMRAVYDASVAGRVATQRKDPIAWRALAAAIRDGVRGRFGSRPEYSVSRTAALQFRILCTVFPRFGRLAMRDSARSAQPHTRSSDAASTELSH